MELAPVLIAVSLVAFDATAASRVKVAYQARGAAAKQTTSHSITTLREIVMPPATGDPAIHQSNPVIASDGTSFLIVWRESTDCCFWYTGQQYQQSRGSLYAATFDVRGRRFGEPTLLSSSATTATPGLAFDGTNYLAVWSEFATLGSSVVARRLSPDSTPVDPSSFDIGRVVSNLDMQIAVACGTDDCLTIFDGGHALVSKNGGVLRLSLEFGGMRSSAIATPDRYAATTTLSKLSLWGPAQQLTLLYAHVFAELPFSQAKVEGPFLINFHEALRYERISSSIASNGSTILIAAVDAPYLSPRELYLINVPSNRNFIGFSPNRSRLEVAPMDGYAAMIRDPQITWNGRRFLLVYQRSNEVLHRPSPDLPREMTKAEITGMWIEPDGSMSGPAFDITNTVKIESLPALAVDARGRIALAFVRGRGGEGSAAARLFVRMLSDGAGRSRPARR